MKKHLTVMLIILVLIVGAIKTAPVKGLSPDELSPTETWCMLMVSHFLITK